MFNTTVMSEYDFRANKMAFSSRTLVWFLSKELHRLAIGVFPSVVSHPFSLASVLIAQSNGMFCNGFYFWGVLTTGVIHQ